MTVEFRRTKTRLDILWGEKDSEWRELKECLQMVLILSHGNVQVERGFSINKECLIENLREESLIWIGTVHDAITARWGLQSLTVIK